MALKHKIPETYRDNNVTGRRNIHSDGRSYFNVQGKLVQIHYE
jgi:hypothetical protein